ncbi:hypothetical protein N8517_00280 [Synechococcus sp. AH-601-L23]|nr:hypothetical protein [Synechococcus sp. AH-601-L23]
MDGDFQQTYQEAERAYGGGDYETAHHLASELLKQLELADPADDDQVRDAVLGWRAFVTLLLGHIELHGLRRPELAAGYYQLTLDCKPQDTLADLAKQGLQRSLVEPSAESLPSMLQDPFLNTAPPASTSGTSQSTAMPWVVEISSSPQPMEAPAPKPKPMGEPVPSNPFPSEPVVTAEVVTAEVEPPDNEQPLPLLIPEESLQNAWLRVSVTPNQTRTDSIRIDQAKPPSRLEKLLQGLRRS